MKQNTWTPWLKNEFVQPYFKELAKFVHDEYEQHTIYPPKELVFSAFENCDYDHVKVVILGQDPYHGKGQGHGMCFSVNPGVKIPPSLQNIYKELHSDLGCRIPNNGYLMPWASQGVFLLNAVLTVREKQPNSHAGKGWETFTDHAIEHINEKETPVVFMLWGNNARKKSELIDHRKHLVLETVHPSPYSANNGFFGCHHFSKANAFLQQHDLEPINWQIEDF